MTLRLAMWSGPRNISTAMMRSWENRTDCEVIDEPFYACYLQATGIEHPMRNEVIASQSTDWDQVGDELLRSRAPIFYQKHMTQHMLPGKDLSWASHLQHCFLIRDPLEVVASYSRKRTSPTTDDIGLIRQLELYRELQESTGQAIPVIEASAVLLEPERMLTRLCNHFGIAFRSEMLSWPAGRRVSDGIWAEHWYQSVENSTGFEPYRARDINLDVAARGVAEASRPAYDALLASPTLIT